MLNHKSNVKCIAVCFPGEQRIANGGEAKGSKAKEAQVKRTEVNINTVQGVSLSSASSAFQKQPLKVGGLILQQTKTSLPQQTLITQQEKDKQPKPTAVNALQQIILPALPTSKATQQSQLQPRFQQQKIILPQPSPTNVAFSTQFSQPQQTPNQQHVLLQLIKQHDDLHRLPNQNSAFGHDKQQLVTQQGQAPKLLPTTGPSPQAHSLSLSYPGFLTFSDPMALSGARVDMMKTTHLAPLPMVPLDSSQTGTKERAQVCPNKGL